MTTTAETGNITGTKDKDYDLIWYVEACLDNALRLDIYIKDAERAGDSELKDASRRRRPTAARAPRWASSCSLAASAADGAPDRLGPTPGRLCGVRLTAWVP